MRLPGLDGLRAGAVTLVVVYHLWPGVLPGGFLGVTVFFALSGYLITTLLRAERTATGRVDIGAFYTRRVRRLLPASLTVLVAVVAVWAAAGWMTGGLRVQVWFTAAQLANWGQVVQDTEYGVTADPSPIVHYWSLAIEEQVYLLLPLLVAFVPRRRALLGIVLAGLALSAALTAMLSERPMLVYFATFTRAGEIFAGVALALIPLGRLVAHRAVRGALPVVAVAAAVAVVVAARTWSIGSDIVSRGGLLAIGAVAAVLVAAVVMMPAVGRMLDVAPLRWIGERSYGIYLIHWPLLVGLTAAGLATHLVPWLTLALTLVLAAALARFVERPLRFGAVRFGRLVPGLAAVSVLTLALAGVGQTRAVEATDFELMAAETRALLERQPATPAPAAVPSAGPSSAGPSSAGPSSTGQSSVSAVRRAESGDLVYSYIGDSKALTLVYGLVTDPPPRWSAGPTVTDLGCPLGRSLRIRYRGFGTELSDQDVTHCDWEPVLGAAGEPGPIDVAVVWAGTWDSVESRLPVGSEAWTTLEDPVHRAWFTAELDALTDVLVDHRDARLVVFVVAPYAERAEDHLIDIYNEMLLELAERRPDEVIVIDIAGWVAATGDAETLMPDGNHLGVDHTEPSAAARRVHDQLIDPAVRAALGGRVGERGDR